jgi:hypothetical protein
METYISEAELTVRAKKFRDTLTYDEKFDFEMETSILYLTDAIRESFNKKSTASQSRMIRYGVHKDKKKHI